MIEFLFKYPAKTWEEATLVLDGPLSALALVFITLTVGAISLVVGRRIKQLSPPRAIAIALLQALAVGIVALMLADPRLVRETLAPTNNEIILILDDSGSMMTADGADRFATARRALEAPWLNDLSSIASITRLLVSSDQPVENFEDLTADNAETHMLDTLSRALARAEDRPIAAIVMASDGIDTSGFEGSATDDRLQASGIPVFTIPVGLTKIDADLGIRQVNLPASTLPGAKIEARLTVEHDTGGSARLRVFSGSELLHADTVALDPDRQHTTIKVPLTPTQPGIQELKFEIESDQTDPHLENNTHTSVLRVRERLMRVLYIEGEPRWEYKFIRRALTEDPVVEIVTHLQVSPNKVYRQGIESAAELADGFPDSAQALFRYDAIILGSLAAASLSAEQHTLIHDYVNDRGGRLLMLAGSRGLGAGGWGETPVGDILPTRLPPSDNDRFHREKAHAEPTQAGYAEAFMRLAEDNREAWATLPELANYQSIGTLKPGARTLLRIATREGSQPLLAVSSFGRGQTYVLGTAGTWRWQMSLPVDDLRHEKFWRGLLRTLVAGAPERNTLQVQADAKGNLQLDASFVSPAWNRYDDAEVTARLTDQSGGETTIALQSVAGSSGQYRATQSDLPAGFYAAEARLETAAGDEVEIARSGARLTSVAAEAKQRRADPDWLARLASRTGGALIAADALDQLADRIKGSEAGARAEVRLAAWNLPAFFLLLVALKSVEWLLRRRWGII